MLTLFVVILPKAHLNSHSRISGSRWVITPSWLSGSWRFFLVQFFCVFLRPLLSIFCFFQVHSISVLLWAHLFMKCSLGVSNFLEEISSLSHSIVFLYFFALRTEEGFPISPWYSLELCIQMGIAFLFSQYKCFCSWCNSWYNSWVCKCHASSRCVWVCCAQSRPAGGVGNVLDSIGNMVLSGVHVEAIASQESSFLIGRWWLLPFPPT